MRHSSISRAANAPGAVLPLVQEFARHRDLSTTFGYVHKIPNREHTARMFEALSAGGASWSAPGFGQGKAAALRRSVYELLLEQPQG